MESPATPHPLDPQEQPILDRILQIRDALLLMKQDKSSYIKSRDVLPHYEDIIAEVEKLNAIRKEQDRRLIHNRCEHQSTFASVIDVGCDSTDIAACDPVDSVLDDCFQLISLLFLTVGRNNESPAVYACRIALWDLFADIAI
jgi:hypothetical protein